MEPSDERLIEIGAHDIERALRGYGVLTRARLEELCGARRWREPMFSSALSAAVRRGAVVKLTDELYELNDAA